jgi:hypothetical protein
MEDELVEDDDARLPSQRLDDPAVHLRVVAHVVESHVGSRRPLPAAGDDDVHPALQRGQEERAVVRDARAIRRKRRVVRDPHGPGPLRLPPGGAGLRRRLTPLPQMGGLRSCRLNAGGAEGKPVLLRRR